VYYTYVFVETYHRTGRVESFKLAGMAQWSVPVHQVQVQVRSIAVQYYGSVPRIASGADEGAQWPELSQVVGARSTMILVH
jgi:hypothetical protein